MEKDYQDRRRFFRIEDEIILSVRVISAQELEDYCQNDGAELSPFTLGGLFAAVDNEFAPMFNKLRKSAPECAKCFEAINRKLDLLAQLISGEVLSSQDEMHAVTANLSASGIAFYSKEKLKLGQILELKLVLLPKKIGLLLHGVVKQLRPDSSGSLVCVDFIRTKEDDQELLVKHTISKQMLSLRKDKNND